MVETAARMSGWFDKRNLPEGRARGFGFARYKNIAAFAAVVVEVEVDEEIRLKQVWCAADAGLVIAPDGARNQIEGGIIQGASFVMKEQIRFEDGQVATAHLGRLSDPALQRHSGNRDRADRQSQRADARASAKPRSGRPAPRSATRWPARSASASAICR